jgi:hypothetical protein
MGSERRKDRKDKILKEKDVNKEKTYKQKNKFRGFSPPANYTDRATAACRRS